MAIKMYVGGDQFFQECCEAAKTKATRRQYKKWTNQKGLAWEKRKEVQDKAK